MIFLYFLLRPQSAHFEEIASSPWWVAGCVWPILLKEPWLASQGYGCKDGQREKCLLCLESPEQLIVSLNASLPENIYSGSFSYFYCSFVYISLTFWSMLHRTTIALAIILISHWNFHVCLLCGFYIYFHLLKKSVLLRYNLHITKSH